LDPQTYRNLLVKDYVEKVKVIIDESRPRRVKNEVIAHVVVRSPVAHIVQGLDQVKLSQLIDFKE
jgi:hypothetical protein